MIGHWHHPVVRLSVTLCILTVRVGVRGYKLHQRVPSTHVPICPFRHFCSRMYRLATKCTTKNELTRARNAISVYGTQAGSRLVVNNGMVPLKGHTVRPPTAGADRVVRTADCRRRSTVIVGSADWQQTDFFYSEVDMLRSQRIALKYCMQYDRLSQQ